MVRERLVERAALAKQFPVNEAAFVTRQDLLRVHGADYVERFLSGTMDEAEIRKIGFPYSEHLVCPSMLPR